MDRNRPPAPLHDLELVQVDAERVLENGARPCRYGFVRMPVREPFEIVGERPILNDPLPDKIVMDDVPVEDIERPA